MASNYHIQKPYVLASLPRSVTQPDGKSVVGEVYGQRPGAKKRRRPEVVVGIDGESVNLHDIAGSRLITSYPIPPQAKFSCPPCSVRIRAAAGKNSEFARYTYVATREPARKLSLFKDTVESSAATSSSTVTTSLGRSSEVIFLATATSPSTGVSSTSVAGAGPPPLAAPDLLAVDKEGQVTCFNGETLKAKYKAQLSKLSQDVLPRGSVVHVDFAQLGPATDVLKGLALGDEYLMGVFPLKIEADGFNPDLLTIITHTSGGQAGVSRYLHVLAVDPNPAGTNNLVQVHSIRLPAVDTANGHDTARPLYRLDMPSGSLFSLENETIVSYDLSRSIPRIVSHMSIPGTTSFLRLSKSSVLAATPAAFAVYNPIFKSLQASTTVDIHTEEGQAVDTSSSSFFLFFSQLELAIAVVDSNLVAVQLEPPKARSRKRRADGLLIDSIGRGVGQPIQNTEVLLEGKDSFPPDNACVPGTVSATYLAQYWEDVQKADKLLEDGNVAGFDDFLAEKFGIQDLTEWRWERPLDNNNADAEAAEETHDDADDARPLTNGTTNGETGAGEDAAADKANGLGTAPTRRDKYPEADRRWIVYAISCVLAVEQPQPSSSLRLVCKLPTSNILNYLVDAGHLSVSNTLSALRPSLQGMDDTDLFVGESLPIVLAGVDPSLDLLLRWLYATKLSATELLSAILLLMRSLELVADASRAEKTPLLLTNGAHNDDDDEDMDGDGKEDSSVKPSSPATAAAVPQENELDQLDQQLHLAEYFLQQVENDPRDLALDIAIGKLGSCPPVTTVQALRRIFKTDEIRSLIEVLRKQLVDQGWATRYVDMGGEEEGEGPAVATSGAANLPGDSATPLDYSVRLIADLLCRCIDAVRPGEWLIDDEVAGVADNGEAAPQDFFASLKWQVSAALEGVQEALYLRGLIGEAVRYATGVQKMEAAAAVAAARAVAGGDDSEDKVRPTRIGEAGALVSAQGPVGGMLPLGLRAPVNLPRHADIAATKVTLGGEVLKRSKRELGHLTSKKIGEYTLDQVALL